MSRADGPPNEFEAGKPRTAARDHAEEKIEGLRQRGGVFVDAVRATRMPMVLTDPNLPGNPIVFANDAFIKLSGYQMDELLGQQPHFMNGRMTNPNDAARFAQAIRGDRDRIIETIQYRKDGSHFVATVLISAFKDEEGRVLNHFMSWLDVTGRAEAEAELARLRRTEAALRESEEQFRLIVESARDYAIFTIDTDGRIQTWLPGAENVFGWSKDEAEGQHFAMTFTPEDCEAGQPDEELETARRDGKAADVRWHMCKDGRRVFIDGHTVALRTSAGTVESFLKIGQDTTDKHRTSQLQATLLAELQHRVRNLLALVRSVIRRSRGSKTKVDDFVQHLEGRIDAMARTQSLLARAPGRGADLEEIIRDEMVAQSAREPQISISGPPVQLSPKAAEVFTLGIHELATNSVKYGALGVAHGQIRISWSTEQRAGTEWLTVIWRENGIDAPASPEAGFGTELITSRVPYELKGRGEMRFENGSLHAMIQFPMERGQSCLQTDAGGTAGGVT